MAYFIICLILVLAIGIPAYRKNRREMEEDSKMEPDKEAIAKWEVEMGRVIYSKEHPNR